MMLDSLGINLNFTSINTYLSEILHAINYQNNERFHIFYLLEIALNKFDVIRKFSHKEIILSTVYLLTEGKRYGKQELVDGIYFERI